MQHRQRGQEPATSFAGTIVMSFHYASTATFYCPASTVKGSLAGTPA